MELLLQNKFIKWFLIPLTLLAMGLISTFIYFFGFNSNSTILYRNHNKNVTTNQNRIIGEIKASNNYLGALSVKFNGTNVSNTTIRFRLKEKGAKKWYYATKYSNDGLFSMPIFPFGFPVIKNSADRTYQFELTSLEGQINEAVSVSNEQPIIVSEYQFPKGVLFKNVETLFDFLKLKIAYNFQYLGLWKILLFNLLPFFAFIAYQSLLKRYIPDRIKNYIFLSFSPFYRPLTVFILLNIVIDVFLIPQTFDIYTSVIIALIAIDLLSHYIPSKKFILLSIMFFLYAMLGSVFGVDSVVEKSSIWTYIFLVMYLCLSIVENYLEFFKKIKNLPVISFVYRICKGTTLLITAFFNILASYTVKALKKVLITPYSLKDVVIITFRLSVIFVIFISVALSFIYVTGKINNRLLRLSLNPEIKIVEPKMAYHSTKIILHGGNFGWNPPEKARLINDYKEVRADLWTGDKIIFTVPLHWKMGKHKLWVEKNAIWEGKKIIVKSDDVVIEIIPRNNFFSPDDNLYFEQLKNLSEEARHINGYE